MLSWRLPLTLWADASARPLPSPPQSWLEGGREDTVCFLTNCWASLTSLFERIPRLVPGRLGEERNFPHPILHISTPNGSSSTQVSTGIGSFRNPVGRPSAHRSEPACRHVSAFQIWQRETCQAAGELWRDKVWRPSRKKGTGLTGGIASKIFGRRPLPFALPGQVRMEADVRVWRLYPDSPH